MSRPVRGTMTWKGDQACSRLLQKAERGAWSTEGQSEGIAPGSGKDGHHWGGGMAQDPRGHPERDPHSPRLSILQQTQNRLTAKA